MVQQVEQPLSTWKSKYLSSGGRITLINVALPNLNIYTVYFKCPMSLSKSLRGCDKDFCGKAWKKRFFFFKFSLIGIQSIYQNIGLALELGHFNSSMM